MALVWYHHINLNTIVYNYAVDQDVQAATGVQ
jgi:hypothetical protein